MSIPPFPWASLTTLLTFLILFAALSISACNTVKAMINLYQLQAWMVAALVFVTAAEGTAFNFPLGTVTVLPIFLALAVKPFLGRATLAVSEQAQEAKPADRGWRAGIGKLWVSLRDAPGEAQLTWLQLGASRLTPTISIGIDVILTVFAFGVSYLIISSGQEGGIDPDSVAVSMALVLVGIFVMINKRDIIAQIIGLLVMEHGLFLAAVKVITIPGLAFVFAISLFFYVLITLTILLWLLPALHRTSGSIDLDAQEQLRG